ncbi:hypothetical protein DPMN_082081 [Dreissena polymorpha]|uniref:Uncharacterized protein n=1 Tax=Dreissena polymorpha TaxID=45954 RepID=A0A9D4B9T3_DREPO|nr:hypothetical protein DPMN_082081 [Dreissena polymorpha]
MAEHLELEGYLQNVSLTKRGMKSNTEYFNALIQTATEYQKIVCFKADMNGHFGSMAEAK